MLPSCGLRAEGQHNTQQRAAVICSCKFSRGKGSREHNLDSGALKCGPEGMAAELEVGGNAAFSPQVGQNHHQWKTASICFHKFPLPHLARFSFEGEEGSSHSWDIRSASISEAIVQVLSRHGYRRRSAVCPLSQSTVGTTPKRRFSSFVFPSPSDPVLSSRACYYSEDSWLYTT